jgi:hypothetical protein
VKDSTEEWVQKYKFSLYAAQYWGFHTKGEPEKSPEICQAIFQLLGSKRKRDLILQIETHGTSSRWSISSWRGQTLLHVISRIGLDTIGSLVLGERPNGHELYLLRVAIEID